jgi:hypothetical protein
MSIFVEISFVFQVAIERMIANGEMKWDVVREKIDSLVHLSLVQFIDYLKLYGHKGAMMTLEWRNDNLQLTLLLYRNYDTVFSMAKSLRQHLYKYSNQDTYLTGNSTACPMLTLTMKSN